jgi:glycosyltransferase involved in cell wall biosynthesis
MRLPTISVITPAHPARLTGGMLTRALHSAHGQTLPPDAIHVAIDLDKQGAAATRQRALMAATTEWVAFLDSDDMFMPQHLERCMKWALETGADFVYSWFRLLALRADGQVRDYGDEDPVFPPGHFQNPFDPENAIETTITTLVRRELAQEVGFQELDRGEGNSGEDRYFTLECVRKGAHITHLVERTWFWTHHEMAPGFPGNTSGRPTKGDAVV